MKNKITSKLLLILVFALFVGMALGRGSKDEDSGKKEIVDSEESEEDTEAEEEDKASVPEEEAEEAEGEMEAVTIEEQVLVEQDGIKITATEMTEDSFWGQGVMLLIENDSDKNISVGCKALIINDYMITDLFSTSVAAGKKVNEPMYFTSRQLKAAGITNVGQIEMYLHITDKDSWTTLFDSECIVIQTSAYEHMDTEIEVEGKELYNQDGIRIVGQYVDENSFWGTAVLLYTENTSGKNVKISCDNMSINGFMVSPIFSSTVYDGKKSFDDITIFSSDLEQNGIEAVEEIELSFKILDPDNYNEIAKSDAISFSVN